MTSVVLLEQLKAFTEKIMADMILPVAMQQGDTEQAYRAPEVYLMRLPDSRAAKKKAPYIIHRVIPLETEQQPGSEERTVVSVRSTFSSSTRKRSIMFRSARSPSCSSGL